MSAGHPRTRQAGGREDQDVSLASRLPAPCPAPAHLCCEVDIVDELRVGQARGPARVTQQAGGGTSETPGSPGFCPFRHTHLRGAGWAPRWSVLGTSIQGELSRSSATTPSHSPAGPRAAASPFSSSYDPAFPAPALQGFPGPHCFWGDAWSPRKTS